MTEFDAVLSAASQLPVSERLRLIDELTSTVPDDQPPALSDEWLAEIERRSAEIDSGEVATKPWEDVRARLLERHGVDRED